MTTQISDTLIYNGESHSLYDELLFHHCRNVILNLNRLEILVLCGGDMLLYTK